uniref:NADH-ubiquinone oxidoreductase chain 5 n=1 Tax=Diartiger fossulatus TaxID=1535458 RepID=A0A0S2M739_9COLE|nr:NADH deshydrogenase subunit 5 [Diartiger fossulatus]
MFSLLCIIYDLVIILEYSLCEINSMLIVFSLLIDWMSLLFMSFVLFISSMVVMYSGEYMHSDMNINRFLILVVLFVVSMMLMILSPNLISILLGWDGLGLVSYCLVIYYQNVKSSNAGMLTALTNRIGDVALLMAIAWMMNYGSWSYYYYIDCMKMDYFMQFIVLLIILAAMTKSAQIPFSSWLPAAMAAPTPVSSLVHSSTLVTAGVYLLIRFNLSMSMDMLKFLLFIGTMTMFMAGLGANFEFDLKKIIALSTLSQLGLMMSILALLEYKLALFHLLTHALFKATLFLCAGTIIHMMNNCQDIRFMGGLVFFIPVTSSIFVISNLSLCGLPFMSGFYSKDLILEVMSMSYLNLYIYIIYFISTGLTVCYTTRLLIYLLVGTFNYNCLNCFYESIGNMLKGMLGLIFFIIMMGSILSWLMFFTPYFICLPYFMKSLALLVSMFGLMLGIEFSLFSLHYKYKMNNMLILFFSSMWNMPIISTFCMNYFWLILGNTLYNNLDQGWFEYYGSQNLYKNFINSSIYMTYFYKNNLKIFLMLFIFWVFIIIFIYLNSLMSA